MTPDRLDAPTLHQRLRAGGEWALIDLRPRPDYLAGHILPGVNIIPSDLVAHFPHSFRDVALISFLPTAGRVRPTRLSRSSMNLDTPYTLSWPVEYLHGLKPHSRCSSGRMSPAPPLWKGLIVYVTHRKSRPRRSPKVSIAPGRPWCWTHGHSPLSYAVTFQVPHPGPVMNSCLVWPTRHLIPPR